MENIKGLKNEMEFIENDKKEINITTSHIKIRLENKNKFKADIRYLLVEQVELKMENKDLQKKYAHWKIKLKSRRKR